ncbi:hypothetical protein C8F04DRAFT_1195832 [Mycena alexandri]|uniref:Uncharacterized protein n=1 Tax=Mycena alexandri TaxID=1745969 RepID=A0AAD6S4Q7_9AGAR|nr:hypothetical protein C8F04DRAFT_1195832 [Mycena alexandri]
MHSEDPPFRSHSTRFIDTSFKIDGEHASQSTRTGDHGILISDDGERRAETLRNITYKKRRIRLRPDKLNDSLAAWIPVQEDDPDLMDADLQATLDLISGSTEPGKRKFYSSSDDPMKEFRDGQEDMLAEMLHLCGLADSIDDPECAMCHAKLDKNATAPEPLVRRLLYVLRCCPGA